MRKVTFATKDSKAPCETPLAVLAFLFCYHAKQKFDSVWDVTLLRYSIIIVPHYAQGDAKDIRQELLVIGR